MNQIPISDASSDIICPTSVFGIINNEVIDALNTLKTLVQHVKIQRTRYHQTMMHISGKFYLLEPYLKPGMLLKTAMIKLYPGSITSQLWESYYVRMVRKLLLLVFSLYLFIQLLVHRYIYIYIIYIYIY